MFRSASAGPSGTNNSSAQVKHPPSAKRQHHASECPDTKSDFPDHPWYDLNHPDIEIFNGEICDHIINPLNRYASIDQGIKDLVAEAEKAKNMPGSQKLKVAVPGEQGIGKSSLINAIFGREILGTSNESRAETAFATIIVHKPGADDSVRESDVTIKFYGKAEIVFLIKEMIKRWTEEYPYGSSNSKEKENSAKFKHAEEEDAEDSPKEKKLKQCWAKSAKEFFEIIFQTKDNGWKQWLDKQLQHTDIRNENFFQECLASAEHQLHHLETTLKVKGGVSEYSDISDKRLRKIRGEAKKRWPFVKHVHIATGHMLLRFGLCLYDLPGYGDISQLREAIINEFRRKADFEMVVVPHARLRSSAIHDEYLGRSIRRRGFERTVVVMTRSDELLRERNFDEQISQVNEEPFNSIMARLEELQDSEDSQVTLRKLRRELFMEALPAYVKREAALNQADLKEKGVRAFSVSAEMHMEWECRDLFDKDPPLNKEDCGILSLRRFLYELPAQSNLQSYQDHVFKTLPHLLDTGNLVFETHTEDEGYAEMRQDLARQIPLLLENLNRLATQQIALTVTNPWSTYEADSLEVRVQRLIEQEWVHRKIHWKGFEKMMKENGIPVNGKYYGHNLNVDMSVLMHPNIKHWRAKLEFAMQEIASCLLKLVQTFETSIRASIERSSASPELKARATDAIQYSSEKTRASHATLLLALEQCLRNTYLHFTTEEDIHCPVARGMKPVFEHTQAIRQGPGVYERTRSDIRESILPRRRGVKPPHPLLDNIQDQLIRHHTDSWKACCDTFIAAAIANLEEFAHTSEMLLKNAAYMTDMHTEARNEVSKVLSGFKIRLKHIQDIFNTTEGEPAGKKVKREPVEDPAASGHWASTPEPDPMNAVVKRPAQPLARQGKFWQRWW